MSLVVTAAEAGLTEAQARAAAKVLDEESAKRDHLVVYLSGAHAYGFPSPDSDLDLKAIHMAPTRALLGLAPAAEVASGERMEIVDGVEIDYSSNELQAALAGLLAGNGNYLERVLGRLVLRSSREHEALVPLARGAVSKRSYKHYRGFASGVLKEFTAAEAPTAKKVLYVLRTALTGAHLLLTGELIVDLTQLMGRYGAGAAQELVDKKRAGERVVLDAVEKTRWLGEAKRALGVLDDARDRSPLPEDAPNRSEVEEWLIDLRQGRL